MICLHTDQTHSFKTIYQHVDVQRYVPHSTACPKLSLSRKNPRGSNNLITHVNRSKVASKLAWLADIAPIHRTTSQRELDLARTV